ncbi:MAG: cobalt-precorrin-6A reductase [Pseudomonadota bacterium]
MRVLLLAGTLEARRVAESLARAGIDAVASLAGGTAQPVALALPTRRGGFGGADGFRAYLAEAGISAVLDATHPFAARISARTAAICGEIGLRYGQILRAPWTPGTGDRWHIVEDAGAAIQLIPPDATAFLATGPGSIAQFAALQARAFCRRIDPTPDPCPLPRGDWLVARPPYSLDAEIALFERLGIDWLMSKNAGGTAGRAKLEAARHLGIKVIMLARPRRSAAEQAAPVFEQSDEAIAWINTLISVG